MGKLGWKVPFRQIYCNTFKQWLKSTFWCHVVIKVFPHCVDLGSDALVPFYPDDPGMFYEQYQWHINRAVLYQNSAPPVGPVADV